MIQCDTNEKPVKESWEDGAYLDWAIQVQYRMNAYVIPLTESLHQHVTPPHPQMTETRPTPPDNLKKIKNKGASVVPTKSERCKKKTNQAALHCAANPNPEKLAETMMQQNYWLTDEHMDHAQWLISRQFPEVKGFHLVLAFESQSPKVEKGLKGFVQIMNTGGSRWVTVINTLLDTTFPNMAIEWPGIQKQEGTSDCGLFATAVAVCAVDIIQVGKHMIRV